MSRLTWSPDVTTSSPDVTISTWRAGCDNYHVEARAYSQEHACPLERPSQETRDEYVIKK